MLAMSFWHGIWRAIADAIPPLSRTLMVKLHLPRMREWFKRAVEARMRAEGGGSTGRGEGQGMRRGGSMSRKIVSGRARRGAHTVEHWRGEVARSEERRGCHRQRYYVVPTPILLYRTRSVVSVRVSVDCRVCGPDRTD